MQLITSYPSPAAENMNQYNDGVEENAKDEVDYEDQLYFHDH